MPSFIPSSLYGGWNKVENGQLTGESTWGVNYDDPIKAKANGWFPEVRAEAPTFDPLTQRLEAVKTLQGDIVAVSYTVVELLEEESNAARRASITQQLTATDAAYKPRWAEDARRGQPPHASEQAWLDERENLRTQLAALPPAPKLGA